MHVRALLLAGIVALAACGGDDASDPFAYDAGAPLAFAVADEQRAGRVRILDVSFAAAGDRVPAFLVEPAGPGPFPVVLFQHGGGSSRADFVGEAAGLAQQGAAGLAIQAPDRGSSRESIVADVVAWRRALDLVERRPDLDERRVAFVGISFGGALGGVLAGVERRIGSYVLMSGPTRWRGEAGVGGLQPVDWIARSDGARFLLQLGTRDDVVPPSDGEALFRAAPEPKELRRYDAGHTLDEQAQQDRLAWLSDRLGLG